MKVDDQCNDHFGREKKRNQRDTDGHTAKCLQQLFVRGVSTDTLGRIILRRAWGACLAAAMTSEPWMQQHQCDSQNVYRPCQMSFGGQNQPQLRTLV